MRHRNRHPRLDYELYVLPLGHNLPVVLDMHSYICRIESVIALISSGRKNPVEKKLLVADIHLSTMHCDFISPLYRHKKRHAEKLSVE